jgi:hypothetical protein
MTASFLADNVYRNFEKSIETLCITSSTCEVCKFYPESGKFVWTYEVSFSDYNGELLVVTVSKEVTDTTRTTTFRLEWKIDIYSEDDYGSLEFLQLLATIKKMANDSIDN